MNRSRISFRTAVATIFVGAALGAIAVVGLIASETRRFVLLPLLWPRLEQPLRTLSRQLALAAVILFGAFSFPNVLILSEGFGHGIRAGQHHLPVLPEG